MDPISPLRRNEECWCGSAIKYKRCHGNYRPGSHRGAEVPQYGGKGTYISPSTILADGAIESSEMPIPLTMPTGKPIAKPISYTNWDEELIGAASDADEALSAIDLGNLRVEVLRRIAGLPKNDGDPNDEIKLAVFNLAAESLRTVAALAQSHPKPTVLSNEELDPAQFLGRTLLLADHLIIPDEVFNALLRQGSNRSLGEAAGQLLEIDALLHAGIVIPLPKGVPMAARGRLVTEMTKKDLADAALESWVREQLIVEGPTAREALLVKVKDDWSLRPEKIWLHAHVRLDEADPEGRSFTSQLLRKYDPAFDYEPWIQQTMDDAVGFFVQRTNERVVSADLYASEYVAASMFEARLLRRRGSSAPSSAAQACVWADIPLLPHLGQKDLAKLLQNENAVDDLRRQVGASLVTARTPGEQVDALTATAHGLEAASHRIERSAISDRAWQGAIPGGLGVGSLMISAMGGGLPAIAGGTLGLLGGLVPYLGGRLNARREAAYLFTTARRRMR